MLNRSKTVITVNSFIRAHNQTVQHNRIAVLMSWLDDRLIDSSRCATRAAPRRAVSKW
jgi:hypothetical protein